MVYFSNHYTIERLVSEEGSSDHTLEDLTIPSAPNSKLPPRATDG